MDTQSSLFAIVALMGILLSFTFCKRSGIANASVEMIKHGPFTIQKKKINERRYDMNRGSSVRSAYSKYKLFHQGQAINFPDALELNTGYPSVWKAFILEGADQPAIIAGSQSIYLLTEENDTARLQPLNEQNSAFASLQWLDAEHGQPGAKQEIYITEDTSAHLGLTGGEYLLINGNTVLHVPDLRMYTFQKSTDLTGGYYTGQVVAFSPDRNKIVFVGSKKPEERSDKFIYALLIYDYTTNTVATLPFDQTETRLYQPDYITTDWISTYFEWHDSYNGTYTLVKRKLDPLPNWEGILTPNFSYLLNPVKEEMLQVLLDFVKGDLSLSDSDVEVEDLGEYWRYIIQSGGHQFVLGYLGKLNTVSFSEHFMDRDTEGNRRIVKQVGEAFSEELRAGKHQDLFTSY